jgi:DNA-binding transcriptional LysR family regulator
LQDFQQGFYNVAMKLEELALLLRVAETASMTMAARHLRVTPAAVSAVIKRVEEELGVRLFERTTRTLQPTEEGLVVLEGCRDVVERWQRTLEQATGARRDLTGTVHLSAPADTTYQLLAPVVVALSRAHPQLQVVVHSTDALQHLHRDAIDMAIRYGPLTDSELAARKLVECPGVLVAAPSYLARRGHPKTPDELADHRAITLQLSSVPVAMWALYGDGRTHQVPTRSPLCGDGYLARRWALEGQGIALKSLFDVIDDLEAGHLIHVLPAYSSGPGAIHAVFPSRRYQPARVLALDAAVTTAFRARFARCTRWLSRTANSPRRRRAGGRAK